ncbi:hypothetical protein [Acidovorax sp.]|uniref:hypothetical protein n=1 Tax=Acidovorax sp. TaxID=1872122 RepID=UPI002ACD5351|nr:hypothetical protein [Acidovorax sp.]MDZ7862464.1 hypothetical protein [Acidovorax sp.]
MPDRAGWQAQSTLYADPGKLLTYENLPEASAELVARIDADVDRIYDQVMGRRQAEYERAEAEGRAYADAGYTGPVPPMVQSHAAAKGWVAQVAADDILAVSAAWRTAQETLRTQRLLRKEQARNALGSASLKAIEATWAGFVAAVRAQLGIGGA